MQIFVYKKILERNSIAELLTFNCEKKTLGNNQHIFQLQLTLFAYCSLRNSEYNRIVPMDWMLVFWLKC
jgi:hypothetical protein